jgi:hypothetical protein
MIALALISRSSDPTGLLVWCVIGFCAGIGLFFYGFRLLQRRRLILDTPFSKIRSAPMGMVEISGLAVGPYDLIAPVTARSCYYYRTLVWEWKQRGKNKEWVRIAGECMHVPFFVDDNTGRLLVDPRGANLDIHRDFQEEFNGSFFSSRDDAPANVTNFLARHGVATSNRIRVEEYCIKPKNSLFILGTLSENPDLEVTPQPVEDTEALDRISGKRFSLSLGSIFSSAGSSDSDFDAAAFARLTAPPAQAQPPMTPLSSQTGQVPSADRTQQQQVVDALLKAGISSPAAWSAAGATAAGVATGGVQVIEDTSAASGNHSANTESNSPAQANGFDRHPPVVLKKGTNNKTFLVSWRSQREVARSLGWKCALMIWGGPVLALVSLYFFLGIEKLL